MASIVGKERFLFVRVEVRAYLELVLPSHIQVVIQTENLPIAQKRHYNLQQILQR